MAAATHTHYSGPMLRFQKLKLGRVIAVAALTCVIGSLYLMQGQLQTLPLPKPSKPHTLPRVAKISMLYGKPNIMYERAILSHERHAARWGYPMHVLRQEIAVGFWNKPSYLLATVINELSKPVDKRIEWMMWVDADSIMLNPAIPAEIFLPPPDLTDIHVVASKDHNGLNTGIMFVRVHPWTVTMLSETIGYPLHHPEVDLGKNADQDVMAGIFKKQQDGPVGMGYADGVIYIPRPLINAYEFAHGFEGDKGSLLVHFPGLGDLRWPHMAKWLSAIERTPNEWERPLAETEYTNTTDVFWSQVREAKTAISWTERNMPSLDNIVEGMEREVNDTRIALKLMKKALREQADDLELMRIRLGELKRLRMVMGWKAE